MNRKKEIAIITLHGYFNYGNRLQNIAISAYLKEIGYTSKNIVFEPENLRNKISNLIHFNNPLVIKQRRIKKETLKLIKESKPTNHYAGYIFGSDQIWNYSFLKDKLPLFLGNWVNDKQKIMFLSASMANDVPNSKIAEIFEKNISELSKISVREEKTQSFLKSLNIKSEIICDPVFLYSSEEWDKILPPRSVINEKYILLYFLNDSENLSDNDLIVKYAEYNNYKVVDLNKLPYKCSNLSEFNQYIKNAELIITNSYHALAFSIIHKKRVQIFSRLTDPSMNERIYTLLKLFNLQPTIVDSFNIEKIIDCSKNTKLSENQNKIKNFVNEFISISLK